MKAEKQLLRNILWNFEMSQFKTQETFVEALIEYNKTITGKDIDVETPVLESAEVRVQYEHWGIDEDGDEDILEPDFLITADNGKTFSTGELLYKIHNEVCEKLKEEDKSFFEGLELWEENESSTPYYTTRLGS